MPRSDIETPDADAIAADLKDAFDRYCPSSAAFSPT